MAAEGSQVWLITGCTSGLGQALAEAVAKGGEDRVVACARGSERIAYMKALAPGRVRCVEMDVRDRESVRRGVAEGAAAFGRIDVLVNNAGVSHFGTVEESSDEIVDMVLGTNLLAHVDVTRAVLPHLRRQRSGRIIVVSSGSGTSAKPGIGLYACAKFGLEGIFEAIALEVAHLGIKVTLVEPGRFKSGFKSKPHRAEIIEDYNEATAAWRSRTAQPYQPEVPDADEFAAVVLRISRLPEPPLRFPIGDDAWNTIRMALNKRLAALDEAQALRDADPELQPARSWPHSAPVLDESGKYI